MPKLSKRLKAAAALTGNGRVLADIGTDHGYVPIYLVAEGKIARAIAMDVNPGPLERAKEHIKAYGMGEYIQTRLSDGVSALFPGEADVLLIAGMGGGLMMRILRQGEAVCQSAEKLVLQPQSELSRVRRFLMEEGYVTDAENMIKEDGKYYPMMRVHYDPQRAVRKDFGAEDIRRWDEVCFCYGERLLLERNMVLEEYLCRERRMQKDILDRLKEKPAAENIVRRIRELEDASELNREALRCFGVS